MRTREFTKSLLICSAIVGLSACGGDSGSSGSTTNTGSTTTTTPTTPTTPTTTSVINQDNYLAIAGKLMTVKPVTLTATKNIYGDLTALGQLIRANGLKPIQAPCSVAGSIGLVFNDKNGNGVFDVNDEVIVTSTSCDQGSGAITNQYSYVVMKNLVFDTVANLSKPAYSVDNTLTLSTGQVARMSNGVKELDAEYLESGSRAYLQFTNFSLSLKSSTTGTNTNYVMSHFANVKASDGFYGRLSQVTGGSIQGIRGTVKIDTLPYEISTATTTNPYSELPDTWDVADSSYVKKMRIYLTSQTVSLLP